MKDLLKEILSTIKQDIYYIDDKGNQIKPEEAAEKGIMVKPINPKIEAKRKLKEAGVDVDDDELIEDLRVVLNQLRGEKFSGIKLKKTPTDNSKKSSKRKTYEDGDIIAYLNAYEKSGKSKTQFAKENDINYQTFMRWFTLDLKKSSK
ncbi:hypothetical protein MM236_01055 [Belliella sp. DSM 107340]|uniref:Uncharacterized protein n=1 Tax=Belliella calami TaxID=2923436 RepID=A0ABS9UJK7_9BACT|nr:hypothetical protein [Belliella calami]MCH7396549.1 hypothetical protein [Belliella calami]